MISEGKIDGEISRGTEKTSKLYHIIKGILGNKETLRKTIYRVCFKLNI
jgi:hypothetical protein